MQKQLTRGLLTIAILCSALCAAACLRPDMTTDDGVRRAYEAVTGNDINKDMFCVHRPKGLEQVVVVGELVMDYGCKMTGVFVGRAMGELKPMTPKGLELNGWADHGKRKKLALSWVQEVVMAFTSVVKEENEDFKKDGTPAFSPPSVENTAMGGVRVELWIIEAGGMLPQHDYTRMAVELDKDGKIAFNDHLDSFTVKFD